MTSSYPSPFCLGADISRLLVFCADAVQTSASASLSASFKVLFCLFEFGAGSWVTSKSGRQFSLGLGGLFKLFNGEV